MSRFLSYYSSTTCSASTMATGCDRRSRDSEEVRACASGSWDFTPFLRVFSDMCSTPRPHSLFFFNLLLNKHEN
jgi:hypothetical protein